MTAVSKPSWFIRTPVFSTTFRNTDPKLFDRTSRNLLEPVTPTTVYVSLASFNAHSTNGILDFFGAVVVTHSTTNSASWIKIDGFVIFFWSDD